MALALLGLALLLPLSLLVHDARWAMAEPAAVEAEALLEAVVEEIRAGARPLTDQTLAPVDLPWPAAHAQGMRVTVGVTAEPTPNLWRLDLVTRYRAGGRARERRLVTLVWRP